MSRRSIAVVGSGIAGLTAGYILSHTDDVTLFEVDDRLGGHAHTHQIRADDDTEVMADSGFIVHNHRTYPLLSRLFRELGVAVQPSEMSMSVSCAGCGLEYAGHRGPGGLLPGLRTGGRRYARMLAEVIRFHRAARRLLASSDGSSEPAGGELTLGQFLQAGGYSRYFTTHFALPFVAAVWSCPPQTALQYPAGYLFAFLDHHGLLSVSGSPPWLTVTGGSRSYVERVSKHLASPRTGTPVTAVRRQPRAVQVSYRDADGCDGAETFAAVVMATHPDQALRLLADPTPGETALLSAFRYARNETVLHTDGSVLPASPRVRSSWNYALPSCAAEHPQVQVSYYLNRLQRLAASQDYVVTLNPDRELAAGSVIARMSYEHPVYDQAAVTAQRRLPELNDGVTAYAGAYHGWGFHEDGCRAGLAAAQSLGGRW
jgi:uncharacterized protein